MKRYILMAAASFMITGPAVAANSYQVAKDEMQNIQRGIAVLNTEGSISPVVKCDRNGPGSIYISFITRTYLGNPPSPYRSRTRPVKVRFDDWAPYDVQALYDGSTANILNIKANTPAAQLLHEMRTAKRMVVQVTDYDHRIYTDAFDLEDAGEVIKQAARTCGDTNVQPYGAD